MTESSAEDREVVAAFARWAVAAESGDQVAARRCAEEALALARSSNSPFVTVAEALVEEAGGAVVRRPRETPSYSCSFCGAPDGGGHRLVAGPDVFICKSCVDSRVEPRAAGPLRDRPCAFCNKSPSDDATLSATDAHSICDGCVRICVEIFASKGDE